MGHPIHKHMNSFKAKNLLGEMPIDNRASALEMDEGSAAYMKDDMAPKMESPMEKELKGGQANLPEELREAIKASPAEMNEDESKKNKYQKAYANKKDMVSNPNKGKKFYMNPSTGLKVKLDKQASQSDKVPQIVLDNLNKRTSGNK